MKMARHNKDYYYNEHDVNQVEKILKTKKKKKLKRRFKILIFLMIFVMIGAYFLSDYSKVRLIRIIGNEEVATQDILDAISVNQESYYLFVNTSKIESEVKAVALIKKASVSKDLLGNIKIEVEETDKVAYCIIGDVTYVIDELGNVVETEDPDVIQSLQACPYLSDFKDLDFLKTFAKAYVDIPELIKNQTSDIIYAPKKSDETRLKFIMNNGKILYLRVEDMVEQLKKFDYEAFMTAYSDRCEFSFEGEHVYMEKCQ